MRAVIQRVKNASVTIDNNVVSAIDIGLLVLLGIEDADDQSDLEYLVKKIAGLRVFSDDSGKMNLSVRDVKGSILVVSQFTLFAETKKGFRPSFTKAGKPEKAQNMVDTFSENIKQTGIKTEKGVFGANMKVNLCNEGPVTIIIDTKEK